MNWDSFFSGVSQATASILGIVLAFIISKILSESSNFLDLEEKLKDTLIDSGEISSLSKELKVNWHDEFILRNDASFHALLDATSFDTINNSELESLLQEHVPRLFTYEDVPHTLANVRQAIGRFGVPVQ